MSNRTAPLIIGHTFDKAIPWVEHVASGRLASIHGLTLEQVALIRSCIGAKLDEFRTMQRSCKPEHPSDVADFIARQAQELQELHNALKP